MTFKYRGITYQANPTTINTNQTQVEGKYRGQSYQLHQSAITVSHPNTLNMVYRGVCYNNNQNVTKKNKGFEHHSFRGEKKKDNSLFQGQILPSSGQASGLE